MATSELFRHPLTRHFDKEFDSWVHGGFGWSPPWRPV
jgi:hypothetical protein